MPPPSEDSIKVTGGMAASVFANAVGIPFDRFRVVVAQDAALANSLVNHLRCTMASLETAYMGGAARIVMKGTASTLNLFTPQDLRDSGPFTAAFVTGLVFAPVLNALRMMQLAKINGEPYTRSAPRLFGSVAGVRSFAHNTAIFAPGEALRMMLCFGTKDFLVPYTRGLSMHQGESGMVSSAPRTEAQVLTRATWLAAIIGPAVAVVESTASLATETASTLHAKLHHVGGAVGGGGAALRAGVLAAAVQPRYIGRCWLSLLAKNVVANSTTFFFMFVADEYAALLRARQPPGLRRRSSVENMFMVCAPHHASALPVRQGSLVPAPTSMSGSQGVIASSSAERT